LRILGLDPGEKRVGVAVTDPLGVTAQGIDVIEYERPAEALEKIETICHSYEVEEIVIGNPLNMDGTGGKASENARLFAEKLRERLKIPVTMVDERLTSVSAERTLISGGVSRKNRKKVKDKLAAVLILEQHLASRRDSRG